MRAIRRVLTALVLSGGLAAVFVTAAATPRRGFPFGGTGYAPIPQQQALALDHHQEHRNIEQTSCVLSWTDLGGIALCRDPAAGSLPPRVTATVHGLLRARAGHGPLTCERPTLQPVVTSGSYIIICVTAGTTQASFSINGLNGPKGSPNAIAVNTFSSTFGH